VDWDTPTDLTDDIGIIYLRDIYQVRHRSERVQ
jgi:hypothetical protein